MVYDNPLHPQIDASNHSGYTTLTPASAFVNRRLSYRLPQQIQYIAPNPKPHQYMMDPARITHISFDRIGSPGKGMPIADLVARSIPGLNTIMKGGEDYVFSGTPCVRITFRIMWPGYLHLNWAHNIDVVSAQGPIARAQLAQAVAQSFARFVEKCRTEVPTQTEYRIGVAGIRLENLILCFIKDASYDAWYADVVIDMRH
ncbi:hypothetical protein D9619_003723 [Psilocybe cf. subviscida]|uniref:Uncharacterized protein n=1 Tax=Psilocybe cf. subviscida TaxID=2480587 RepID=A0A8H5EUA4_9AGAR|nr:hypothetical protein D9619_003723 [Psilocybe cf. subviscida]